MATLTSGTQTDYRESECQTVPLGSPEGVNPFDHEQDERGLGMYHTSNARVEESLSRLWQMKQKTKEKKLEQLKQIHKKETYLLNKENLKRRYQLYPGLNKLEPNEFLKFEYSCSPGKPMLHVEEHRHFNDAMPSFQVSDTLLETRQQKPRVRGKEKMPGGDKRPGTTRKEKSKIAILSEFKIAVRSATPTVEDVENVDTRAAALLIQTTIKGRSDQIKMQRGKKLHQELIKQMLEKGPPPREKAVPKEVVEDNENEGEGRFDISEQSEAVRKSRDDDLYQFFK